MPGAASLPYPAPIGAEDFKCAGSILKRRLALQSAPFFSKLGGSFPSGRGEREVWDVSPDKTRVTSLFLADDEEQARRELEAIFADCPHYRVVGAASDGAAAVEGCRRLRPDVALLDIQMPVLSGTGAAKLILEGGYAKCVVMLTAYSDRESVREALEAGAFGYLTKPFQADKLLPALEICLSRSREYHLLCKERRNLDRRLGERETVDRVKLLLMETKGMTEEEAYRYIRELSRRKQLSMARVAGYLIEQLGGKAP